MGAGIWCNTEGDIYNNLSAVAPVPNAPVFTSVWLIAQYYGIPDMHTATGFDKIQREVDRLNAAYPGRFVFLLPSDLMATYKQYAQSVKGPSFYQDINYNGYCVPLGVGNYTTAQLHSLGIQNNDISSIKVPSGYIVTAYQDDNFGGSSLIKTADDPTLVDDGWNDQISSIKIAEAPTFYKDSNYGGYAVTLGPGDYTLAQLQAAGIQNDDISSMKIPIGYTVTAYQDDNFGGSSLIKTADVPNLVDDGWNDRISSIKIKLNKALGKTASASGYVTGEYPYMAVDGTTLNNSKWCSGNAGDKWLMLDLGQNYDITRWVVKHAGGCGEPASYNTKDFKLQKGDDGNTWTDVDSVTGNTANITDRSVSTFNSRFVRLYITAGSSVDNVARIYELELY